MRVPTVSVLFNLSRRGFVALLLATLAACTTPVPPPSDSAQGSSASAQDSAATRVVALTSLTADLVATLAGDRLVGIPGSSLLRNDPRFAAATVVSEGRVEPNLEKIIALEPDLVLGAKGFHDKVLARLEELGVPVLTVEVASWDALESVTQDLAERLGADSSPLLARYQDCLAQAPAQAPTALVLVSRQPLLSPNRESWAGDFLTQFRFQNLTADLQGDSSLGGYVTLSEEQVLAANPELLLVVETEENLLEQLKQDAFWGQLAATKTEAVHTFDYFGLINPGSLASIEATCKRLARLGR